MAGFTLTIGNPKGKSKTTRKRRLARHTARVARKQAKLSLNVLLFG